MEFFMMGGPMMWPLLLLALLVIAISIKKIFDLLIKKEDNPTLLERGINAVLFWGGISAVLGFYAHFLGIYNAMQAISQAHNISPAIVSMGYSQSLITILFGLFIFLVSAILWFFLRWKYKTMTRKV